jgi:hypothetical protein
MDTLWKILSDTMTDCAFACTSRSCDKNDIAHDLLLRLQANKLLGERPTVCVTRRASTLMRAGGRDEATPFCWNQLQATQTA